MKVLHVAETVKGGVATIIDQLLLDERVDSFCLIPDQHESEIKNKKNYKSYVRTGRNLKSFFKLAIAFIKYLKFVKPDIIHIHSSFAGIICRLILFFTFTKPKIIYCPHAFSFMMDTTSFKKKIYVALERVFLINTDLVICTSEYEKNIGLSYGFSDKKLVTVYNSVLPPLVSFSKDENSLQTNNIKVLFVGRLDYQKGVDVLEDIINKVGENFEFTAVGDSVVNKKNKALLPNKVKQVGWVNRTQLARFYSETDIVIMPSRWESFGLVAVEANSYGKPVLATDCTSLPEIIKHNVNGFLFEKDNPANAITILKSLHVEELKEMKNACIKKYEKNFSTQVMLNNVYNIYSSLHM